MKFKLESSLYCRQFGSFAVYIKDLKDSDKLLQVIELFIAEGNIVASAGDDYYAEFSYDKSWYDADQIPAIWKRIKAVVK